MLQKERYELHRTFQNVWFAKLLWVESMARSDGVLTRCIANCAQPLKVKKIIGNEVGFLVYTCGEKKTQSKSPWDVRRYNLLL
jgi:hypothetical protein